MSYGLIATAGGVGVDKAADFQVALSSNWPILKIHAIVPISSINASPANPPVIYAHNLGYAPAFMVISDGPSPNIAANTSGQTATNMLNNGFFVDANNLYNDGFETDFAKGFVAIFEFDIINKVIVSPALSPSIGQTSGKNEIGLEVATSNHSVSSSNPRDIQLTTANRPMQIHMSGSFNQTGVTPVTIQHGLGYLPVCFIYQQLGSRLYNAAALVTGDLNSLTFRGVQAELDLCYFIILKDAFNS